MKFKVGRSITFAAMSITRVTLKPGKDQSLRRYHPWVFSGAIQKMDALASEGEIVEVCNSEGQFLGLGHFAEGSIAVRIFSFTDLPIDDAFWQEKVQQAFNLRTRSNLTNNSETTIYRLVHGEGDGLPGLIVDIYGSTAVIQAHTHGMHQVKMDICKALLAVCGDKLKAVYDKSAEKLHGVENSYLYGEKSDSICLEYGSKFQIDWEGGQKTGFFIDQRENRKLLAEYSFGKKVINTFCYTGAFSIYALKASATMVHSLDSSQRALDLTSEIVALNGFGSDRHETIKADAVDYLKQMGDDYDVIVLDPPAFAKHLGARHKAVQGYRRINEAAFRKIKPGGIVFTFSCSQAIDKDLFRGAVMAAAIDARRKVRILHQLHQPADHPISLFHPEGEYLKGLVLEVE